MISRVWALIIFSIGIIIGFTTAALCASARRAEDWQEAYEKGVKDMRDAIRKRLKSNSNYCVTCGAEMPEGDHVCVLCKRKYCL
jgi:hypothetical protein